jgi:nicotinic acid mononucleotide adenylyltransferase
VDAFADLLSWKSYRELLQRVALVVANRRGFTESDRLMRIAQSLGYSQKPDMWYGTRGLRNIYFLETSPVEISSSHIRDMVAAGCQRVAGVNQAVLDYARRHKLYLKCS